MKVDEWHTITIWKWDGQTSQKDEGKKNTSHLWKGTGERERERCVFVSVCPYKSEIESKSEERHTK